MKHPYPADLKEVFSTGVTVNTDWFFQDYLGSVKRIDYKIAGLHNGNLIIKN
jgi:hypothetical protein